MTTRSGMHSYDDWAESTLDEMDAGLAAFEARMRQAAAALAAGRRSGLKAALDRMDAEDDVCDPARHAAPDAFKCIDDIATSKSKVRE